ncbi:MAG TPA: TonB-dependent receptor [Longimicrobiaceae bacterium]|nr:TonB-dependent receptor [Longimicrobiaceae bacterium]
MKNRTLRAAAGAASVLALAATHPGSAGAQERPLPTHVEDTVVVTARRYPSLRTEVPQKIEVITGRDIRRSAADEITDLLKEQAAVDVVQYPGLLSGIGIRGFRPEFSWINQRTLILIDGRPAGITNLATVDLNAVERVEVLKGPAASLYGSSAMGGAVNLITRRSTGALHGGASAAYGSWETLDLSAHVGGSLTDRVDTDLSISRFSRGEDYRVGEGNLFRGWVGSEQAVKIFADARREPVAEGGDGVVRPNTRYGYRSGTGRLGVRLTGALRADVRGAVFHADDVEGPGDLYSSFDPGTRKNLGRRTGEVSLGGTLGRHTPLFRAFAGREETEYFDTYAEDPYVSFTSEVDSWGVQLQDAVRIGAHTVTAGADLTALGSSSGAFSGPGVRRAPFSPDAGVASAAVFAEGKLSLLRGRVTATAGGRLDHTTLEIRETPLRTDLRPGEEDFSVFSPSAGLQYTPAEGVRLHATVGRAFVTPDALFKAGLGLTRTSAGTANITLGNPELDPERSWSWDTGIGFSRPRLGLDADVTYFHTRVEDRISTVSASFPAAARPRTAEGVPVGSVTTWVNANRARMEGIEWRLGYDLGALAGSRYSLRLFANATHYLNREETTRSVQVDAARFTGRTDFRPEEVVGALVFGAATDRDIFNVANATLNYGVEFDDLERFSTRLTGRYVGERLDVDFSDFSRVSDIEYPAFMTLDLVSTVRLAERYSVSVIVDNLTDENYYEKRGFNLPGRQVRLRLSADF